MRATNELTNDCYVGVHQGLVGGISGMTDLRC